MSTAGVLAARAALRAGSKSFALAGRLLPPSVRDDAAVVYAFCRRCDDAVDLAPPDEQPRALPRLRAALDAVYAPTPPSDPLLLALRDVAGRRQIPRRCFDDLLDGMAMDARGQRYETVEELLVYCYRVAGTVGLMMAHVMGVQDPAALRRAVDLGIAMQLTNICRDVAEDWQAGRLYLPRSLLPTEVRIESTGPAIRALLDRGQAFYRSADAGLFALPWRCAIAIRTARLVYSAIGGVLARRGHDPLAGRAVVSRGRKVLLALRALLEGVVVLPAWLGRRRVRGRARPPAVPFTLPGAPAREAAE